MLSTSDGRDKQAKIHTPDVQAIRVNDFVYVCGGKAGGFENDKECSGFQTELPVYGTR